LRLNRVPGIDVKPEAFSRRPSFDLLLLRDPDALAAFFSAMEWFVARVKQR